MDWRISIEFNLACASPKGEKNTSPVSNRVSRFDRAGGRLDTAAIAANDLPAGNHGIV